MKILFETGSTCIGGAERVVLRLARGIRKLRPDWQLDAIVMCDRGGLEAEYRETFPTLIDGPGPIGYFQSAGPALARAVKAGGYDLCHCIDSFEQTAEAARACPETRFMQAVYPNIEKSPFAPSAEWMNDPELPYAALVTEFKANATRLPKLPRGQVLTIPNGIDTDFWTPAPMETIDATWKVRPDGTIDQTVYPNGKMVASTRDIDVLWCARTDPEKGIGMALELAPLLCGVGLRYMIVTSEGDGPHSELRAMAMKHPTLRFRWKEQPEKLRGYFRRSKIFLSTSQVEGMPATPLEAAACGCWPLVPDIDGLAECFADSSLLKYQPGKAAGSLANIVKYNVRAFNEAKVCPRVRKIACRYSLENMVNRYLTLYESLVIKENWKWRPF